MIGGEKVLKMKRYTAGIQSPGHGRELQAAIIQGAL